MNMALFDSMAGVKMIPVHYRGATPALNDLIGDHINTMVVSVASGLPAYKAGQIKMLGVGAPKRMPLVPEVPTVSESGLPGYEATAWFGLFGPAGMPQDIVMKIDREVIKIFSDPAFRARFLDPQMFESMAGPPDEFEAYIKAERAKWAKVIHDDDIKIGDKRRVGKSRRYTGGYMRKAVVALLVGLAPVLAYGADRPDWAFPVTDKVQPPVQDDGGVENCAGQRQGLHTQADRRSVQSAGLVPGHASADAAGGRPWQWRHGARLRGLPPADRHGSR